MLLFSPWLAMAATEKPRDPPPKPPRRRPHMSYEKRWKVALRQRWRCNHCRSHLPETAEMDHCIPLHAGGGNTLDNLQLLCPNCHALKTRSDRKRYKP